MTSAALRAYGGLGLAVTSGIAGMSLVYGAASSGSMHQLTIGVPLLFLGLWWSGRELGRSTLAHRARKAAAEDCGVPPDALAPRRNRAGR
jgi:hypothetical protein